MTIVIPFWDNLSKQISSKLWNPPLNLTIDQTKRIQFLCNHPDISFEYFIGNLVDKFITFNDLPIIDNQQKKDKLFSSLFNKENKRYFNRLDILFKKSDFDSIQKAYDKHKLIINKDRWVYP